MNKKLLKLFHYFRIDAVFTMMIVIALTQFAFADPSLKRIELLEYVLSQEVQLGIGKMIESGMVQPISVITNSEDKANKWILRGPRGSKNLYWYQDLLTSSPGSPDLTINPRLLGVYDIYIQVRAVRLEKNDSKRADSSSMAFQLGLDDGSKREIVGVNGFSQYHYDTEVLAAYHWNLSNRKLVLRNLNKPVYIYGFRFVPASTNISPEVNKQHGYRKVSRWSACDHVTIVKEPHRHFAFPGIAKLKNGDIVVVYREGTQHNTEGSGKVSLSRSKDGGMTWLPRITMIDGPGDDRDPGIYEMSTGMLIATSGGRMLTSNDSGYTWSRPIFTPVSSPHGVVEDEYGSILYAGEEVIQKAFTRIDNRSAVLRACSVYRSKDKGASWGRLGIATHTLYMTGAENFLWQREPSLCVVPNRLLIMATSNRMPGDGFIRIIRSTNHGKTWGPIIVTPVRGKPAHLLWLGGSRVLMTYSYRYPPWGVRACISYDNGETWDIENEIIIRMDGGTPEGLPRKVWDGDLGYPVSIRLDDKKIFTVYYFNKNGSNAYIEGTFWQLPSSATTK